MKNQLDTIRRGTVEIVSEDELIEKLSNGKPLRIKAGFDPTAADLHLGHTVIMQKLHQFQELGHKIIFLIGDFTARIGDPSGRDETRPMLSEKIIRQNAETYIAQASKIIDMDKAEVRYNSEWLGKMSTMDFLALGSKQTVARMLERDDFKQRMKAGHDITILEFYYPLMQAHDSVVLQADVELGGTDQLFNLLMGRTIQKRSGQNPQCIITLPLLLGTDGVQKMSKTYNNSVDIQEPAQEIFGKVMSICDPLMWSYFELLTDRSSEDIEAMKNGVDAGDLHPKAAKIQLAMELTERFHDQEAAESAALEFERVFASKQLPSEIEEFEIKTSEAEYPLMEVITESGMTASKSEARRMIEQGGVKVNEEKISDIKQNLKCKGEYLLQVGKRRFKRVRF
jgi:tyrosyl-tRNA synthetase